MRQKSRRRWTGADSCARSAAAPAAAAAASPIAPTEAEAYDPGKEETKARYRETDDVKAFYRTNGYET